MGGPGTAIHQPNGGFSYDAGFHQVQFLAWVFHFHESFRTSNLETIEALGHAPNPETSGKVMERSV